MRLPVLLTVIVVIVAVFLGVGAIWGIRTERARLEDEAERRLRATLSTSAAFLERDAESRFEAAIGEGRRFLESGEEPTPRDAEAPLVLVFRPDGLRLRPRTARLRREESLLPTEGEALGYLREARRNFSAGKPEVGASFLRLAAEGKDPAVRAAARVVSARRLIEGGREEEALPILREVLDGEDPLATPARLYAMTRLVADAVRRRDAARIETLAIEIETDFVPLAGDGPTGRALARTLVAELAAGAPEIADRLGRAVERAAAESERIRTWLPSGAPEPATLPAGRIVTLPLAGRAGAVLRQDADGGIRGLVVVLPPVGLPSPPAAEGTRLRVVVDAASDPRQPLSGYLAGLTLTAEATTEAVAFPWRSALVIGFLSLCFLALAFGLRAVWRGIRREEEELSSRTEFLAGVSHQLKTPVANLRLFAETLASGRVDDEQERARMEGIIGVEAERLGENLERILAVARLDTHRAESGPIDAEALLRAVDARWESVAARCGISWEALIPAGLPGLRGDERALADALHNVVDNAVRNSRERGRVRFVARREGSDLVVDVIDEGPGIPRAEVGRVFERFFRGSAGHGEGSGLGLAIARDGAARAGGTVRVAATGDEGTTMRFRLPERGEG